MKALVNVLWYCWIAVGIAFVCQLGYLGYDLYMEERLLIQLGEEEEKAFLESHDKEELEAFALSCVMVLDCDINARSLDKLDLYYSAVPWEIRKAFAANGWKLVVTDQDISSTYYNGPIKGELAGLTNSRTKTIYIHENINHIRNALLHEFGHYFDLQKGIVSDDEIMQACFQREKGAFDGRWKDDTHAMSNEAEYFAESFQQYILDPKGCKEKQPVTYRHLATIIDEK